MTIGAHIPIVSRRLLLPASSASTRDTSQMLHHIESHPLFPLPIVWIDDLAGDSLLFLPLSPCIVREGTDFRACLPSINHSSSRPAEPLSRLTLRRTGHVSYSPSDFSGSHWLSNGRTAAGLVMEPGFAGRGKSSGERKTNSGFNVEHGLRR